MNKQIDTLRKLLGEKIPNKSNAEVESKISLFEVESGLLIPADLTEYFKLFENSKYKLDLDLYEFYSFDQFKSVDNELSNWGGSPDYRNIVNTLNGSKDCFLFAEYMAHLFVYAVRLYPGRSVVNEVYLICGDKYKIVAESFSAFLEMYFAESEDIKVI